MYTLWDAYTYRFVSLFVYIRGGIHTRWRVYIRVKLYIYALHIHALYAPHTRSVCTYTKKRVYIRRHLNFFFKCPEVAGEDHPLAKRPLWSRISYFQKPNLKRWPRKWRKTDLTPDHFKFIETAIFGKSEALRTTRTQGNFIKRGCWCNRVYIRPIVCTYATGMLTCMYMRHIQVCILSCIYTRINAYTYAHASGYIYAMGIYTRKGLYIHNKRA